MTVEAYFAENNIEYFHEFENFMNLDPSYVLKLDMDGPSVNKSFEEKLVIELHDQGIQILKYRNLLSTKSS